MATHSSILAWTEEPGGGGCYSPRSRKESDMTEQLSQYSIDIESGLVIVWG